MPEGDWLRNRPLVLILCYVAVLLTLHLHQDEKPRARGEYASTYEAGDRSPNAELPGTSAPVRNPNPDRNEWRQEQDLIAQWAAAGGSILGGLAAAIGVILLIKTLDASLAANRIAETTAIAARRAWVDATIWADGALTFNIKGNVVATVRSSFRNHGLTPAYGVYAVVRLYVGNDEQEFLANLLAEDRVQNAGRGAYVAEIVFPGDPVQNDRPTTIIIPYPTGVSFPNFWLVGWVEYRCDGFDTLRMTPVCYHVDLLPPHNPAGHAFPQGDWKLVRAGVSIAPT